MPKDDQAWKKKLSPEKYRILREAGTEAAFSGEYDLHFDDGMYKCGGCGNVIFDSESKYDSGCGWPAFDKVVKGAVELEEDHSFSMHRTSVTCAKCGGHLGHVFDDGPKETTGQRFCINSLALDFKPKDKK